MWSTNPICVGVPIDGGDPVILDVTTSMVAEGKLMVAVNKGERVPEGWIIDRDGAPTTDPAAFYDGTILPLFQPRNGIVYVLPDTKPLAAVFRAAVTRTAHR